MVGLRRDLHRFPETGFSEHRTTRKVAEQLLAWGLTPRIRPAGTGLTVDIGEGDHVVAFRADLDGLPIQEATDVPFRSEHPGVMHACGHDVHTSVGVGIAGILKDMDLPGRVRFVFQPAEEQIPGGAVEMRREGAVDDVDAIYAFHVDPSLPAGRIGVRTGGITGASDRLVIRLHGPGGHTSRPHQTVDLAYAAARVVTDLPGLVRRGVDPRETIAIVFGRIEGGSAENVIPTTIELGGTARMFDLELWHAMPKLVEQHVHDLVAPIGATAEVIYEQGSPPVVNDARLMKIVERVGTDILGPTGISETYQSLGSEDFAWFLETCPGALIRLGAGLPGRHIDLHSATFDVDEAAIQHGIAVGAGVLLATLESL